MDVDELIVSLRRKHTPMSRSDVPKHFVELLDGLLQAAQISAEPVLGGSYAKGTFLEGDHDVDIFVRFDAKYSDEEMPDLLGLALGGWEGLQRIHGSRDYFQLEKEGFLFEIVPVLKVAKAVDARNVTDVSPLHVRYVKEHIKQDPSLAADIRLAKLFCKAAKVYGAESYVNGFSGHVLDNLIIHYGSFKKFLEAAVAWPEKVFIDPLGTHEDAGFLNQAKRQGPLVLIDPVQPGRNAAAALSMERFGMFKAAARAFLAAPDESFFIAVPLTKEGVLQAYPDAPSLCYTLRSLPGADDVVGTKLLKVHEFFLREAEGLGFVVVAQGFEFFGRESFCYVVVHTEPLPEECEVMGPPLAVKKDATRFREAHPGRVVSRNGRLYATKKRECLTLLGLFTKIREHPYVKDRVAGTKVI